MDYLQAWKTTDPSRNDKTVTELPKVNPLSPPKKTMHSQTACTSSELEEDVGLMVASTWLGWSVNNAGLCTTVPALVSMYQRVNWN